MRIYAVVGLFHELFAVLTPLCKILQKMLLYIDEDFPINNNPEILQQIRIRTKTII